MKSSCLVVVGEKSGEEHFMSFFPQLKNLLPQVEFYGVGGNDMQQLGFLNIFHLRDFSSMGFSEIIQKIPFYFAAFKRLLKEVELRQTKWAILVDFQEFNYQLAKKLKKNGVQVLYYVAPQAWIWRSYRALGLAKTVHTLFCLLPFEKKWFQERGLKQLVSIPHPILKRFEKYQESIKQKKNKLKGPWNLLLLPGSRVSEVENLLPIFLRTVLKLKERYDLHVSLVQASILDKHVFYAVKDVVDKVYCSDELETALLDADLCLAASGTVTLQCGLFALPTVVCYQISLLSAFIYREFIGYEGFISLTNIIHQKRIFPELLQERANEYEIERILLNWLEHPEIMHEIQKNLLITANLLSGDSIDVPQYMAKLLSSGA